ncbi:MAG TPA: hypothetical protein VMW65_00360, partial [Chloroflexota bacterium]|nr:hypothetical protein [Chloroflexota bacterium]
HGVALVAQNDKQLRPTNLPNDGLPHGRQFDLRVLERRTHRSISLLEWLSQADQMTLFSSTNPSVT